MIQETEVSGWIANAYDAFISETGDPAFGVSLEQYNLSLALRYSGGAGSNLATFDAIVCGSVLVRAWPDTDKVVIETMVTEDSVNQTWSSQNVVATDIDTTIAISLAVSGNTVRIFWYDGDTVKYNESVDNGAAWGGITTASAIADLEFLAASALTRVHCLTRTTKNNLRFHALKYNGSWSDTASQLYWPFTPTSFDAVAGGQVDDGAAATNDVIAMTTDLPPMIGVKVVNTELVHILERVQGVVVLRYQNGRYSDHLNMDVMDNVPSPPSRHSLRLSSYDEWLFMTYIRKDGTATGYVHESIALSRSRDGVSWELPYLLTKFSSGPAVLLKRGNHAYVVDSLVTYRSFSVGYTGDAKIAQDISEDVLSINTKMGDIQDVQLTVGNPEQVLDSTVPFSSDAILQARVELGYYISDVATVQQVLLADVDVITGSKKLPTDHIVIGGRDILSRLMTVRADYVQEWETQAAGGDNFESADDTDYSGMRRTAVYGGTWKTPAGENILALLSSQNPGVAFNTYVRDAQNGAIQSGVIVPSTDVGDYAGVCFRAYDKQNLWYTAYKPDADQLVLVERRQDADQVQTYVNMGWAFDTQYYIMARFRYGLIQVYTSTDGINWTESISFECSGIQSAADWTFGNLPNLTGRMGYVGYGYTAPGVDPGYDFIPPPLGLPDVLPDDGEAGEYLGAGGEGGFAYTANALAASPTWNDWNDDMDDSSWVGSVCQDPGDPEAAACIDATGAVYTTDDWRGVFSWSKALSIAALVTLIEAEIGVTPTAAHIVDVKAFVVGSNTMLFAVAEYKEAPYWRTVVLRSPDFGNSWACGQPVPGKIDDSYLYEDTGDDISVAARGELAWDGSRLYYCAQTPHVTGRAAFSCFNWSGDYGESWQTAGTYAGGNLTEDPGPACAKATSGGVLYVVPWNADNSTDNADEDGNAGGGGSVGTGVYYGGPACWDGAPPGLSTAPVAVVENLGATTTYTAYASAAADSFTADHCGDTASINLTAEKKVGGVWMFLAALSEISPGGSGVYIQTEATGLTGFTALRVTMAGVSVTAPHIGIVSIVATTEDAMDDEDPIYDPYGADPKIGRAASPETDEDILTEKWLEDSDGIARYRGMFEILADDAWCALQIVSGGSRTSQTVVLVDDATKATLKRPFRTVYGHPEDEDILYLGRSWISGEEATPTYPQVVYISLDGGVSYHNATGDITLESVTGFVVDH